MESESFLGLGVRANDGTDLGRVTDVITDGATGEVTHLLLEWGGVHAEVAVSAVALDEDGEFATYSPDAKTSQANNASVGPPLGHSRQSQGSDRALQHDVSYAK